jgi:arginase
LRLLTVASGLGAGDARTAEAPAALMAAGLGARLAALGYDVDRHHLPLSRSDSPSAADEKHAAISDICRAVAGEAADAIASGERMLVLGGDHSIAAGTWAGAARALRHRGPIGLVWIDAHMDAHTPATTPSGNWHGMPIAHLLGEGDAELAALAGDGPALEANAVSIVGVRSYEPDEAALLTRLGVRVIGMDEIVRRGLPAVMSDALAIARRASAGFGISLDIDAIDPLAAPGVGTPVAGGITPADLRAALAGIAAALDCLGLEVVELNPARDIGHRTRDLVLALIEHAFATADLAGRAFPAAAE